MAIHPSLKISDKDKKARSVMKRAERLRTMIEKSQWKPGDNVYGLPKMKTIRIKIKKEKAEKPAEGAAAPAAGAATAPAKEAAAKAPAKGQEKK